jgi:hypothetical protein
MVAEAKRESERRFFFGRQIFETIELNEVDS